MPMLLLDRIIETSYGEFTITWGENTWDGDHDRYFADQQNGWVGAAVPDVVYVALARYGGGSSVRIESWEHTPPRDAGWEDAVEVSIVLSEGISELRWSSWAAEEGGDFELPAASYRLRVSARGRDAGRAGEFEDAVVDFYLLQLWPAAVEPDAILAVGSEDAAYWHETIGHRRDRPSASS